MCELAGAHTRDQSILNCTKKYTVLDGVETAYVYEEKQLPLRYIATLAAVERFSPSILLCIVITHCVLTRKSKNANEEEKEERGRRFLA